MPMHDWTRVEAGIYHSFHQGWISEINRALNGRLPPDYYALAEAAAGGYVADALTLHHPDPPAADGSPEAGGTATATRTRQTPATTFAAVTPGGGVKLKKSNVAIRHASDDRVVAVIELVSPGNKRSRDAFRTFVRKAVGLLRNKIHLLLVDPFPPGPRDPSGIHPPVWRRLGGDPLDLPADKPLTFSAYDADRIATRTYIERLAVGDPVPDMPVFLQPGEFVDVPLRDTYAAAFAAVPTRWRRVIDPTAG